MIWIIIASCAIIAGAFEGYMDHLQFHYKGSHIFWQPDISWKNKWKVSHYKGLEKIHVGEERFLGSSSIFVFLTDGWHLMKWCRNRSGNVAMILLLIALGISAAKSISIVISLEILYHAGFYLGYKRKP